MSGPRRTTNRGGHPPVIDMLAMAERVARASGQPITPRPLDIAPNIEDLRDARGYRRPPQTFGAYHEGREPNNKGHRYPPDPPTILECIGMLGACGPDLYGRRMFAAIVLMWQGALRAFEALAITEADLDQESGRIIIRRGKGNKQATIKMSAWAWPFLAGWRDLRHDLPNPTGSLLCVIDGPTAGRPWKYSDMNKRLKVVAVKAGVTKRISPHQLRHAFAVQAYQDGVPLKALQAHLRHENVGITDAYLQGLGLDDSLDQVYNRAMPTIPATALLALSALGDKT